MLTARELSQLRADVLETLVATCTILRPTASVDSAGIASESWGTAGTAVLCRIDPERQRDPAGMVAGREAMRTYFVGTFEWDADIAEGDRVVVAGDTLELLQLYDIHSDRAVTRARLAKIQGS